VYSFATNFSENSNQQRQKHIFKATKIALSWQNIWMFDEKDIILRQQKEI
jgi:hypothetical protein